jgi:serine/threonine-protein kinase RsbW
VNGKNVNSIELRLPSRLGFEKIAMSTASSVAKLMGFAPDRVEDLKTAVAEACINAMEHGNKLDESLIVGVVLSMDETSLEVKVLDTGTGPPSGVHTPDMDKKMHGEEASRGMGMFLIQSLVDEAEWVSAPLTGSYARLVIRLKNTED